MPPKNLKFNSPPTTTSIHSLKYLHYNNILKAIRELDDVDKLDSDEELSLQAFPSQKLINANHCEWNFFFHAFSLYENNKTQKYTKEHKDNL